MPYTLPVARLIDREVVEALASICTEAKLVGNPRLVIYGVDGALSVDAPPNEITSHPELLQIFELGSSVVRSFRVNVGGRDILSVERPDNTVHDTVQSIGGSARDANVTPVAFTKLVALAKQKLRELRVDSQHPSSGDTSFDAATKARYEAIRDLEQLSASVTIKAHDHLVELDRRYQARLGELKAEIESERAKADAQLAAERARLAEREKALDAREEEIDRSDAKAARRKLRENLRTTLREHSQRFELSKTTRGLRLPTALLLLAILGATGALTYTSFLDVSAALASTNPDWWRIAILVVKQVFFAATFLGFAAFTIRWFDSWSRRHADAEFRFKQLELDVDRASWVVEVAQEWHKDQGKEVPAELLAQLSNHLFSDPADASDSDTPEGLAAILGGGSEAEA